MPISTASSHPRKSVASSVYLPRLRIGGRCRRRLERLCKSFGRVKEGSQSRNRQRASSYSARKATPIQWPLRKYDNAERFVTVMQKHHRRRDSVVSCLPALKGAGFAMKVESPSAPTSARGYISHVVRSFYICRRPAQFGVCSRPEPVSGMSIKEGSACFS